MVNNDDLTELHLMMQLMVIKKVFNADWWCLIIVNDGW
jgi:hypothetical protein